MEIHSGNKAREKGHKRKGRKATLYNPRYYKRVTENNINRIQHFILDLDLFPSWCLHGFHLPKGARPIATRFVKGQFGRTAFNEELPANGSNQYVTQFSSGSH